MLTGTGLHSFIHSYRTIHSRFKSRTVNTVSSSWETIDYQREQSARRRQSVYQDSLSDLSSRERRLPISSLYNSIAGHYRPVRVADGPIMVRCRFIKNASWATILTVTWKNSPPKQCSKKSTKKQSSRSRDPSTISRDGSKKQIHKNHR